MIHLMKIRTLFSVLALVAGGALAQEKPLTRAQLDFFEKKIRPVLVNNCYECHSHGKKIKGGLRVDTKDAIRLGGDTGPAIVPKDVKDSLLIEAIRWTDEDLQMPPKKKLSESVIHDLERWVQMGAPDPRAGGTVIRREIDLEAGKKFWAFQPLDHSQPETKNTSWAKYAIDRYVLR